MRQPAYTIPNRPFLFHPVIILGGGWGMVVFLYTLHLSDLLLFSSLDALQLASIIVVPFLAAYTGVEVLLGNILAEAPQRRRCTGLSLKTLDRRLSFAFRAWICLTIVEIVASGGLPLVWAFTGNSKTYFDFGIPSIHGLMNSVLLSISITRLGLALRFGRKKDYRYLIFNLVWAVICITRQMIMVVLLEATIIYFFHRKVRPMRLVWGFVGVAIVIIGFGVIGDMRSGAEAFRLLAQPTRAFPDWAPSGLLWIYIYITTPINNLINTAHYTYPVYDALLPNTAAMLFPSVIRAIIYKSAASDAISGNLVAEAFNVSTAFVGPFQDLGSYGVAAISALYGVISTLYWRKRSFRSVLIYTIFAQCLALTIFYNHFFYLPIVFQVVWMYIFFAGSDGNPLPDVTDRRTSQDQASTVPTI